MTQPLSFIRQRLLAEIEQVKKLMEYPVEVSDPTLTNFPIEVTITIQKIPGPYLKDGKLSTRYTHKFKIIVDAEYPYKKPVIHWLTPIFHPNIMPPHEGGYICTKMLKVWSSQSSIVSFIQGVITLLSNPNPYDPLGSDACLMSAQYFVKHPYHPPSILKKGEED
ncbi:MAG: hypothetical protein M1481_06335 [Candidatus Thermoplasmatota archaeon]|jgi:ubiquitin-conjugating enzyme E2 C|nr:hypothetical protein [Candidatus Thermoplasmatota archaeon]MCL5962802.1 hypothetical protein [Candidatus Thermoplasmatota archaeon]